MTWLTVRPQISLWYYGAVVLEIFCGAHRKGRGTKKKSRLQFFSFRVEFYDTCSRPFALPHRKPAKALSRSKTDKKGPYPRYGMRASYALEKRR